DRGHQQDAERLRELTPRERSSDSPDRQLEILREVATGERVERADRDVPDGKGGHEARDERAPRIRTVLRPFASRAMQTERGPGRQGRDPTTEEEGGLLRLRRVAAEQRGEPLRQAASDAICERAAPDGRGEEETEGMAPSSCARDMRYDHRDQDRPDR